MGNHTSRITSKRRYKSEHSLDALARNRSHTLSHLSQAQAVPGKLEPALDRLDAILQKASEMQRHSVSMTDVKRMSLATDDEDDRRREHDRWQRQHCLLKYARKANVWTTLVSPKVIVDSGAGDGIWAFEMASEYKHTKVIGIDVRRPSLPLKEPDNLEYFEADITKRWPMDDNTVDFIFQRHMGLVIRKSVWPYVLSEMLRVLKPGGKIELLECDRIHHHSGPTHQELDSFYEEFCNDNDFDFRFTETLGTQIQEAGLGSLDHRTFDIPIGEWSEDPELKKLGFINMEAEKSYMHQHKKIFLSRYSLSAEEYDREIQKLQLESKEYQGFTRFNCWIAEKPLSS